MLTHMQCKALCEDIQVSVIEQNQEILGIDGDMVELLCDAIDCSQYRRNGSLSCVYSTNSKGYTNHVYKSLHIVSSKS